MAFQTVILVGNLGRDPEMRYTPSGEPVTSFSVATSREYTGKDGKVKETTWFRISVWGKMAEVCNNYLRKGSKVLVEGRLTPDPATGAPRIWTGKDGRQGTSYEITASTVRFLSSRTESAEGGGSYAGGGGEDAGDMMVGEDDIPF